MSLRFGFPFSVVATTVALLSACSAENTDGDDPAAGGAMGFAGNVGMGGGLAGAAGTLANGGTAPIGGMPGVGGTLAMGGAFAAGGATAAGGGFAAGGMVAAGGLSSAGSSGMGQAGLGEAGMGQAGMGQAGASNDPPEVAACLARAMQEGGFNECAECSCRQCTTETKNCFESGDADRDAKCAAIVNCARSSGCKGTDCYCGTDVDVLTCVLGTPTGVCKDAINAAAGITMDNPVEVQAQQMNPDTAVGRANAVSVCAQGNDMMAGKCDTC